jgi:hypothetical protein
MKKIRLTCNWCTDEQIFERFSRVFITSENKDDNYQFTVDNDFDYLVVVNFSNNHLNFPREKTLGVMLEPTWACYFEQHLQSRCRHILHHTKRDNAQYIYHPGLLAPHFDYHNGENLDYYINNKFNKTKKCSIITSNNSVDSFPQAIYSKRVNFVKQILNTDLDIDIYGNDWEKCGIDDKRIKGTLANKKDGLLDYEFSIAIENSVESDYFSEKLTDCILTDTTPIYFGCPDASRFFKNIYQLSTLESVDELKAILQNKPVSQLDNKKLLSSKYNFYVAVTKYFNTISV